LVYGGLRKYRAHYIIKILGHFALTSLFGVLAGFRDLDHYLFYRLFMVVWIVSMGISLSIITYYGYRGYVSCLGAPEAAAIIKKNLLMVWGIVGPGVIILAIEVAIPDST